MGNDSKLGSGSVGERDKRAAYNAGWRMTRNPNDSRFWAQPPRDELLRHYFYQGVDDARRTMMPRSVA